MAVWPTIVDDLTRLNKALFDAIKAYIDNLISVQGVPPGGATNDILKKASAADYDDAWTDAPTLDSVTLDTAAAEATGIAKIFWDATEGTVAFGMAGGVVTQQLGRNAFVRCKNVTASQINRGQVVYLTGAQGDRPTIELADATDESTSADTIGIAAEDIPVSAEGEVCISGILANVNTYGLTAGVMTYLSETAGAWTQTRPTQPAHGVRLGIPLKISNSPSGNSGVFFVQINNGYELEELHDVLISTPAAYDILQRNAANTLWVNTPSSSISIGTAADLGGGTAGQIPYQASPGDTQFFGPGTAGDILKSNGTSAPSYSAPAALTKTDDTNVTLTLGGSASTALVNAASITAGWTGTLAASRLNSNVVQAVTNDTNVTGSIATQNLTLGWTGTLAAARLNANVVQSVVNDTNVTGSIATQALTLGWTGQLSIARGGTGASSAQAAINALAGAVTSGSYLRGNGTNVVMSTIQAGDVPTLNQNTTGSAATLTTARTINGTSFNGSANITTASWGTARTLTIGDTGKSVDGSGNVSWTLTEIGVLPRFGAATTSGTLDWNSNTRPGTSPTLLLGSATNGPGGGNYFHPFSLEYGGTYDGSGQITQLAISYATPANELWMRGRYTGAWSSWVRFLNSSNYNSYAVAGAGFSTNQNLNTSNTVTFATLRTDRYEDSGGTFLFRVGATTGTTRHINLADNTGDPAAVTTGNGISWGARGDSLPYYIIYTRNYNNGYQTYSRLVLAWYTGIEIGALPSYGGTRFFNSSPGIAGATEIFSVGRGDNNVRVNNNLYVAGSLVTPIQVATSSVGSTLRALRIINSGTNPASFGSYFGAWRSTIEIWDNAGTRLLHLTPPDGTTYNYSTIKSTDAGIRFDVGSGGGLQAVEIAASGVSTFNYTVNIVNNAIAGTGGRNFFKDSERSDGNGLRVGAAWGLYGIYAEVGAGVIGGADGVSMQSNAVRLTTAGNFGINTTTPGARLDVVGNALLGPASGKMFIGDVGHGITYAALAHQDYATTTGYAFLAGSNGYTFINKRSAAGSIIGFRKDNADMMVLTNDGHLAIAATARLYLDGVAASGNTYIHENSADLIHVVAGGSAYGFATTAFGSITDNARSCGAAANRWTAVYAVNGTIQTSDRTRKRDITPTPLGLDFVRQLQPIEFSYTDEAPIQRRQGLIAQEVLALVDRRHLNGIITGDKEGEYGINYAGLVPALIAAIQAQDARIAALEAQR